MCDLEPHEHEDPEADHAHVSGAQAQLGTIALPQLMLGNAVEVQAVTHGLHQQHGTSKPARI